MRIYIIRHGETPWNKLRKLQGRSDIELNDEGRRLARITSKALGDVDFTHIFTSPLKRAKETAQIIRGDRDIEIVDEPRIQEISFGIYEGLSCLKDNYEIPDPKFDYFFSKPEEYIAPPGAESIEQLWARTGEFLDELVHDESMKDATVLLSTHGAALKGLMAYINNTKSKADFWGTSGVHRNCAVTTVDVHDGVCELIEEGRVYY